MLYIKCPYCGLRAQKEFSYGGDATVKRPNINEEVSSEDWDNFVYMRKSPRGKHIELWQHIAGVDNGLRCKETLVHTKFSKQQKSQKK